LQFPDVSEPNWLNAEESRLWRGFISSSAAVFQSIKADLKASSGMSLEDYEVLVRLSEDPENRITMSELSQRLYNSKSRVTQHIDRMEKRGLVSREQSASDHRSTFAVITTQGMDAITEASRDHVESVRRHLEDHFTPQEAKSAADGFDRLIHSKGNLTKEET
jgi:DNA-binding MarR family transcriptional regulator